MIRFHIDKNLLVVFLLTLISVKAFGEQGVLRNGTIGYVMTDLFWAVYQTDDAKEECPKGFNMGPREQFTKLFPNHETMSVQQTQLKQEILTWYPNDEPDQFPFNYVEGSLSYGLNLDGEVSPNDFIHPSGIKGIDNEIYRAVGCIVGFRGPLGVEFIFQNKAIIDERFSRMMIELEDVDDLQNDDQVKVTFFRGLNKHLTNAVGDTAMPGGTQRVDSRWGASLIRETNGRIIDGTLVTEPIDSVILPWMNLGVKSIQIIRDFRLELNLSESGAEGLIAGYADIDVWHKQLIRNDSTHHLSNGDISGISLYKALKNLADGHPDPVSGKNTTISTALDVKMVQTFIVR